MSEFMARIGMANTVEIVDDLSVQVAGIDRMLPNAAAFFARGILACAAVLCGPNRPKDGTIIGDAHLPIMKWSVGTSHGTEGPAMILTIPSGIELTFVMPPDSAKMLGNALVLQGSGSGPPDGQRGTVH
jgi:hypothetical protein